MLYPLKLKLSLLYGFINCTIFVNLNLKRKNQVKKSVEEKLFLFILILIVASNITNTENFIKLFNIPE